MKIDWLSLTGLLISTGLLILLWRMAGKFQLSLRGLSILLDKLHHQTWIRSTETTKHEEIEKPINNLPQNISQMGIISIRICLVVLYALTVIVIVGRYIKIN